MIEGMKRRRAWSLGTQFLSPIDAAMNGDQPGINQGFNSSYLREFGSGASILMAAVSKDRMAALPQINAGGAFREVTVANTQF